MNAAHFHLILNHLPVVGTILGLALLAAALVKGDDTWKKLSLAFFVLVGLLAIPAYLTGEPAEGVVQSLPDVPKGLIEQHEEAAGWAFGSVLALGVAAIGGLVFFRRGRPVPTWFGLAMLVFSMAVSGAMAWTANLGGKVRHTEIRPVARATTSLDDVSGFTPL